MLEKEQREKFWRFKKELLPDKTCEMSEDKRWKKEKIFGNASKMSLLAFFFEKRLRYKKVSVAIQGVNCYNGFI